MKLTVVLPVLAVKEALAEQGWLLLTVTVVQVVSLQVWPDELVPVDIRQTL